MRTLTSRVRTVFLACFCVGFVCPSVAADHAGGGQRRPVSAADAAAGKPLYLSECSACHGERGDGSGLAAEFLDPRPRDFTRREFKYRTTDSGVSPTTSDVLRTMQRGIAGTAMPPFSFLSADERKKIAAYVLQLAGVLEQPEPQPIPHPGTPPPVTRELLAKGKQSYADAGCATCHGALGKGDGQSAKDLKDTNGRPIKPRDFTQGVFRGGGERVDLYYRLATGMSGTPMPAYRDALRPAELWTLTAYVLSLRESPVVKPRPSDPIAAGREVAVKYSCRACHALDDGQGGDVGPDLRVSGQKLSADWVRRFLEAPRGYGKIYPRRVYRMPQLGFSNEEIDVLTAYLAAMGKRPDKPMALPDPTTFPEAKVEEGKRHFVLRCAQCHALGTVVETPLAEQQGPDLIHVAGRVDYDWAKDWILNPEQIDPRTRMTAPGLTPEQVDAVRMFVWKASLAASARQPPHRIAPDRRARHPPQPALGASARG